MTTLDEKVAVVYGGGGVIGGAILRIFAREGTHVYVAGRTRDPLNHGERPFSPMPRGGTAQRRSATTSVMATGVLSPTGRS